MLKGKHLAIKERTIRIHKILNDLKDTILLH